MELNDRYRILSSTDTLILQFHEMREAQILNKETKKWENTGEMKEFTENYYYPGLESALRGFLRKETIGIEKAEELLIKLDEVQETIKSINK